MQLHLVHRQSDAAGHPQHGRRETRRSSDAVVRTGLRRVDWVRLIVDSDGAGMAAQVEGVGYRSLVRRPVPLSLAHELIASGTPYVVRSLDPEGDR